MLGIPHAASAGERVRSEIDTDVISQPTVHTRSHPLADEGSVALDSVMLNEGFSRHVRQVESE